MTQDLKQKLAELEERGELFPAIPILEQLVEGEPDNEEYKLRLAVACIDTGQVEKAEAVLRACVDGGSENPRVRLNLGHALKALGKSDEAAACYLEVARHEDDSRSAVGYWSLGNMRSFRFDDLLVTELRDRVQQSDIGSPFRGLMLFALAAAWEQKENYEAAFMAMSEANLIFAAQRPFRGDLFGQMVKSMCETVREPAALPPPDGPTPIFIVGMPRSGTTLVEQILAVDPRLDADALQAIEQQFGDLRLAGGRPRCRSLRLRCRRAWLPARREREASASGRGTARHLGAPTVQRRGCGTPERPHPSCPSRIPCRPDVPLVASPVR